MTSTDTSVVKILWFDAYADHDSPKTTYSGSMGGIPPAIANCLALRQVRRDAKLELVLPFRHMVTAGLRVVDPMEQHLLDVNRIKNITVDDSRSHTQNIYDEMDALGAVSDITYIRMDLDMPDAKELPFNNDPTKYGPTGHELAAMFKEICTKYPKTAAIAFA